MQVIVGLVEEQQSELDGLLSDLDEAGWARPSPCEGWSVADVVLHLAQTNEMATASAQHRLPQVMAALTEGLPPARDVDHGAGLMVERDRSIGARAIDDRWRRSCSDLRDALLACDPSDRVEWVAGRLAARTLGTTRLAETWIHTTDVAGGLGVELAPTDRLHDVARLAWRTLPYAFQRAGVDPPGPVAFRLTSPSGAEWAFGGDDAPTRVTGTAHDLCRVAGQRADAVDTDLVGEGPDAAEVLRLVRTFA